MGTEGRADRVSSREYPPGKLMRRNEWRVDLWWSAVPRRVRRVRDEFACASVPLPPP